MRWMVFLLPAVLSCAGPGGGGAVAAAVIATAVGVSASAVNRANGGCYAMCPADTVCNEATGLCERAECEGRCTADQICTRQGLDEVCVARLPATLAAESRLRVGTSTVPIMIHPGPIPPDPRFPGEP